MKCIKVFIITILSFLLFPISGMAASLEKLPSSESSDQWEVIIDMPKSKDLEPKPEVYNIYSMDVTYLGNEDVKLDRVEVYRDTPDSSYDIELFTVTSDGDLEIEKNKEQPSISHQNFPISTKATKLKVIITWKSEDDGSRKYKEEFIFDQ